MRLDPEAIRRAQELRARWSDGRLSSMTRDEARVAILAEAPDMGESALSYFLAQCRTEAPTPVATPEAPFVPVMDDSVVPVSVSLFHALAHCYGFSTVTSASVAGVSQQTAMAAVKRRLGSKAPELRRTWAIPRTQRNGKGITRKQAIELYMEHSHALRALLNWIASLGPYITMDAALKQGRVVVLNGMAEAIQD